MDLNITDLQDSLRKPIIGEHCPNDELHAFVPEGYEIKSLQHLLPSPSRKKARVTMADADSFIAYVKKHAEPGTTLYCDSNFEAQTVSIVGILNEHSTDAAQWRDHTATYSPNQTVEWKRWNANNKKQMSQVDFATFLEENLGDIAAIEGMPTGTQMLTMALQFEANADKRFKSKIGLQGGGVNLEFVSTDDKETLERMVFFERFTLGLRVFISGSGYPLEARLKYRQTNEKLTFWYELIRQDRVFQDAITDDIAKIKDGTGNLLLNGNPGLPK